MTVLKSHSAAFFLQNISPQDGAFVDFGTPLKLILTYIPGWGEGSGFTLTALDLEARTAKLKTSR